MRQLIRKHVQDTFEVNKTSLPTILADIRDGRLQLPNLQRSWRWPDEHIVSLLESIAVNHPVGAIMAIETGGELKFQHRGFEGTAEDLGERVAPSHLMLDGQQRGTSLFQACFSKRPVKVESEKRAKYRRYFFDMAKALYEPGPLSDAIISLPVDWQGVPLRRDGVDYTKTDVQFQNLVFPVNEMFDFSDWDRRFHVHWDADDIDRKMASEARQTARDFHSVIVQAFTTCMVPVIMLRRGMTVAGVCKVYENLNSKGVPLDAFDLLIAHFAAEGYCLRTDWFGPRGQPGTKKTLEDASAGILDDIEPKQFMQAVLLTHGLSTGVDVGIEKDDLLSLKLESYLANRDAVIGGFASASTFLKEDMVSAKTAPSMLYIICLAAIFAYIGDDAAADEAVRQKLRRWLWTSALCSSFAAHSTRVMAEAVPAVVEWLLRDGPEPSTLVRPIVTFGDIKNAKKGGTVHKALSAAIVREGVVDVVSGLPLVPEHLNGEAAEEVIVFPLAWCKENAIPAEMADSIVNRVLVSPQNRTQLGKVVPSEVLVRLAAFNGLSPEAIDANILTQGIDPAHLRADDFDAFFQARLEWMAGVIEAVTGTRVISDDDILALQARALPEAPVDEEYVPEGYMWRSSSRGGTAFMKADGDQFMVLAGSIMSPDATPSLDQRFAVERECMISDGSVRQEDDGSWFLLEDRVFKSPSHAYSVFTGQKAVGRIWKDTDGTPVNPTLNGDGNEDSVIENDPSPLLATETEQSMTDDASKADGDEQREDGVSNDEGEVFETVLKNIEEVLGEPLFKAEGRSHFRTAGGVGVKFSRTAPYRGTDDGFFKVRPQHFEDEYFVLWKDRSGEGWMIPTAKLRDFLECIPTSARVDGNASWDPRVGNVDGRDLLWTNIDRFGTLDITSYAFSA